MRAITIRKLFDPRSTDASMWRAGIAPPATGASDLTLFSGESEDGNSDIGESSCGESDSGGFGSRDLDGDESEWGEPDWGESRNGSSIEPDLRGQARSVF
ncbi:MAG: hypothetical protein MI919_40495 [Holophagales bacterium]|nr:hypothetical protein [Holophagales bacterium]